MSQITTHVLDTSIGQPAEGIRIMLQEEIEEEVWNDVAIGVTNSDGRIANFIAKDRTIQPGIYRMHFDIRSYFETHNKKVFYPEVVVMFEISNTRHYHIPLLLSPFGYSTYRGS